MSASISQPSMTSDSPFLMTLPHAISAKNKIGKIASVYDPLKTSFQGFEGRSLKPTEFREQMRTTFQLNLTDAELGALVTMCDKDNNHEIDSVEFINELFRLGKLTLNSFRSCFLFIEFKSDAISLL